MAPAGSGRAVRAKPAPVPKAAEEEPLLRSLDHWWFGYGSPTSLGLYRILLGTIAFLNFLMISGDWGIWYGENGFVPAWLGQVSLGKTVATGFGFDLNRIGLVSGVTDPRLAVAFFVLTIVAAATTALGLWTRVSTFVLAIGMVSLHHRDTLILHGGDTVMRIMAIYLAVAPCGRACSLDRLFRLRRGEEEGPVEVALYGQRLVEFNVALIYFTTVWSKTFGPTWLNGTATWYTSHLREFYRFPVPGFLSAMPFVRLSTYGTIVAEFSMATLVFFRPLRKYVLMLGITLHAFIEYAMNIPLFSFLMISSYVCFFDGEEVAAYCRRLGERLRPLMGLEVYLPPGARLSPNGARFLHAVDPFGFVRYLPNAHPREVDLGWDAKKDDGKRSNPFRGVAYRAPGAWAFLVVPRLWRRIQLGCVEGT